MSTKKKIVIGIGVFLGLVVVAGLVAYLTTGKERDLASQFVSDVANSRYSSAYDQFSLELKEVQDQDTFESQLATLSLDTSCKLTVSGVSNTTGTSGAKKTVTGSVKCDDKSLDTAEFAYNGDSKLVSYRLRP
ncbi:MAG: hypothetical protein WBB39_02390 [Candidatus Saccharimonadales bacterium]